MARKSSDSSIENFYPSNKILPKEKLKIKAEVELNETEELVEESLQELKKLIQDHKVRCITNTDFLLRFLRSRNFVVQSSFEALKEYAKFRSSYDHWFSNPKPQVMDTYLRKGMGQILPYRDPKGRLIFFSKSGIWNKHIFTDEEYAVCFIAMINYLSEDVNTQISGAVMITDERGFRLADVIHIMRYFKCLLNFISIALPLNAHRSHYINEPQHYTIIRKIGERIIPEKHMSKLMFHGKERQRLFEEIPRTILPVECGGSLDYTPNDDQFIKTMNDYLQKLKEEQIFFRPE